MIPGWLQNMEALCKAQCSPATSGLAYSVTLSPEQIPAAASLLLEAGFFIEDVLGTDLTEGVEVQYHFDRWDEPCRVCLRALLDRDDPAVPTISHIFDGASWHERETRDFYGVRFEGHPNLTPLLLPDDMTLHPLLKTPEARCSINDVAPLAHRVDCSTPGTPTLSPQPEEAAQ